MLEHSVADFLEKAASRSPAPGGGCIAALAGAMGASMACMSANFTIGKKGYENCRQEAEALLKSLDAARKKLSELAEEDVVSYESLAAAYKLGAETGEQKELKRETVKKALMEAIRAPFETASECAGAIKMLPRLAEIGNRNLISDVGVAASLLNSALASAALNVEINLKAIGDGEMTRRTRETLDRWLREGGETSGKVLQTVNREIKR